MNKKTIILNTIRDLCLDFIYYDREEDEELSKDQLNDAIRNGEISIDEIVAEFRKHLDQIIDKILKDKND